MQHLLAVHPLEMQELQLAQVALFLPQVEPKAPKAQPDQLQAVLPPTCLLCLLRSQVAAFQLMEVLVEQVAVEPQVLLQVLLVAALATRKAPAQLLPVQLAMVLAVLVQQGVLVQQAVQAQVHQEQGLLVEPLPVVPLVQGLPLVTAQVVQVH